MISYLFIAFIFGSCVGSFLNVVVDRMVRGESILGWSYCDHCATTLSALDLVPIISFIGLGARCRRCGKKISWQYPIVETITAILFTLALYVLTAGNLLSIPLLTYWYFLIAIAIIVAVVDFKYSLIPTTFVFFASLVALFYSFFSYYPALFVEHVTSAFGASILFLVIVVLTKGRGMGSGDIVLGFLMGMVLGLRGTFLALFVAFFSGAVIALLLVALGKKKFGQTVPFAPFLVFGLIVGLFWTNEIIGWYLGMLY